MTAAQLAMQVDRPAGPTMRLRPYQEEAIGNALAARDRGIRRTLLVAATGLGKTPCFVGLGERLQARTLVLAHRDELIEQAVGKFYEFWPQADVGVVKAARNEAAANVVVASVQTLHERRLAQFPRDFDLVVVDEAHHSTAASYRRILDYLGCFREDGPLLFGVTATADRGDGRGLGEVYQEILDPEYSILWGIRNGYLSDLRAREVSLELDLEGVKVTRGDYDEGELGRVMGAADAPHHIAAAWQQEAADRKTLAFLPTVSLASDTADAFAALGVPAGFVSGETPLEERRQILADFRVGRIQVLTNCGVCTEGYDEPSIKCVIPKPTKSRLQFTQMAGRGTRKFPGKHNCLILDVSGSVKEHDLVTTASLFGLPRRALKTMSVAEAAALKESGKLSGGEDVSGSQLADQPQGTLVAKDVDLFASARLAWLPLSAGRFALPIQDGAVCLQPTNYLDGTWTIVETSEGGGRRVLREGVSLEFAQGVGEDRVRECGAVALVHRHAAWRKKPAGDKQRRAVASLGIALSDDLTAGEASDYITIRRLERTLRSGP